jgi:hypothetical protein
MAGALTRKLGTMCALPPFTLIWLGPVWGLLGLCRLAILVVPLRRLAPLFGQDMGASAWVPLATPRQIARARDIRRTIGLAAGYCPWQAACYPQALAARLIMGLYGVPHALHFGLRRDGVEGEVAAHAWVVCGPVAVTGGEGFGTHAVVRSFAPRGLTCPS